MATASAARTHELVYTTLITVVVTVVLTEVIKSMLTKQSVPGLPGG